MSRPRVVLRHRPADADPGRAVAAMAADGVIHAEFRVAPLTLAGADRRPEGVVGAVAAAIAGAPDGDRVRLVVSVSRDDPVESVRSLVESDAMGLDPVVGVALEAGSGRPLSGSGALDSHLDLLGLAADRGLGVVLDLGPDDPVDGVVAALDRGPVDRIGLGPALLLDAIREGDRLGSLGPVAARVRDAGTAVEAGIAVEAGLGPGRDDAVRLLFDAGVRVVPDDVAVAGHSPGFTDVERAACVERAATAAFVPDDERDRLVERVRAGWDVHPARLVHLAERSRWDARGGGPYLPAEFGRDGFVHLSALHQVLTPANRFYRGRDDLVAVVVDAHLLGRAVVWEAGTDAIERFPHCYGAIGPDAVLAEVPFPPGPDGGFVLPAPLVRAVQGASASRGSSPNSRRSVP